MLRRNHTTRYVLEHQLRALWRFPAGWWMVHDDVGYVMHHIKFNVGGNSNNG